MDEVDDEVIRTDEITDFIAVEDKVVSACGFRLV